MKKRKIKQITNTNKENKKRGTFLQVALEHSKKLGQVVCSKDKYSIYRTGVFM